MKTQDNVTSGSYIYTSYIDSSSDSNILSVNNGDGTYTPITSGFSVSIDTNGLPAIGYTGTTINAMYNLSSVCISELYRRIYRVVKSTAVLQLDDGTFTQQLSATVGYPLSKSSDCSLSSLSSGQVLRYNGSCLLYTSPSPRD